MLDGAKTFRLLMCMKDEPGALYTTLRTLSNVNWYGDSIEEHQDEDSEKYELDIKYITVETCERFASPSSALFNFPTHPLMAIKPRMRFHAMMELVKRENNSQNQQSAKKDILAIFEITACLTKEYPTKAILELLETLIVDDKDSIRIVIPRTNKPIQKHFLSMSEELQKERINLETRIKSLYAKKKNNCPKMGTCPLAHYSIDMSGFPLYVQNQEDILIDITYIRDYGCYSRLSTLIEIVGEIKSNPKHNVQDTPLINAIILTIHYKKDDNIISQYKKSLGDKLKKLHFLVYLDNDRIYAMRPIHTCEYYLCYIVRSFYPELIVGDK